MPVRSGLCAADGAGIATYVDVSTQSIARVKLEDSESADEQAHLPAATLTRLAKETSLDDLKVLLAVRPNDGDESVHAGVIIHGPGGRQWSAVRALPQIAGLVPTGTNDCEVK